MIYKNNLCRGFRLSIRADTPRQPAVLLAFTSKENGVSTTVLLTQLTLTVRLIVSDVFTLKIDQRPLRADAAASSQRSVFAALLWTPVCHLVHQRLVKAAETAVPVDTCMQTGLRTLKYVTTVLGPHGSKASHRAATGNFLYCYVNICRLQL